MLVHKINVQGTLVANLKKDKCSWCLGCDLYIQYHDDEWGRPNFDTQHLFEMINLEGAQAGLRWITILKKREGYRKLFSEFDPEKVARFTDAKLDKISSNPDIVRHKQKVYAVRKNAQALLRLRDSGEEFSDFVWKYVDHSPFDNKARKLSDIPGSTSVSTQMSKDLKREGFAFVGPTTCYAFMQAAGLVNDHLIHCPCYRQVKL